MRLNEYASTRRTRGSYKIPTSVQKSIPIDEIYADGTWRSGEVYSQMWSVSDINYAMQSDDKKQDILAKMGRIYSNIPTDCWAQLCIVSQRMDEIWTISLLRHCSSRCRTSFCPLPFSLWKPRTLTAKSRIPG